MGNDTCPDDNSQLEIMNDSIPSSAPTEHTFSLLRTPPLTDPTARFSTLTPNLRDMINDFSQNPVHTDILSSPDATTFYNALSSGSPAIRSLYGSQGIITPILSQHEANPFITDTAADRKARLAKVSDEMNALFGTPSLNEMHNPRNQREGTHETVVSAMSSPDLYKPQSSNDKITENEEKYDENFTQSETNSSSETPPPQENSGRSLSISPQIKTSPNQKEKAKQKRLRTKPLTVIEKPSPQHTEKGTKHSKKNGGKLTTSSVGLNTATIHSKQLPLPTVTTLPPRHPAGLPLPNGTPYNSAMLGLLPFTQGISPAMPQQLIAAPGALPFPGRSMAIVPGANGNEMIPLNMFQATAMQYSAVQAVHAANAARAAHAVHAAHAAHAAQAVQAIQAMHGAKGTDLNASMHPFLQQMVHNNELSQSAAQLEPISGSRKKRRRQMLERSACSEEQARENRARALSRLRQKKTLQTQNSTVRYACRKRIAMVRPRVNGRFATKEEAEESRKTEKEI